MISSAKILWGEGLFLRPQHFQRQDAYHEGRLAEVARALHPYSWGLRQLQVDTQALSAGMLRITALQAIFPDGDLYSAPRDDELPAPLSLAGLPPGVSQAEVHLTLAPMRAASGNFSRDALGEDGGARFVQHEAPAADWFTEAVEAPLATLRRRARVVLEGEPRHHLASLPLLRLRRQGTGGFELDEGFVPPSLSLQAAPALQALLRRLLEVLQAKVQALYGLHREPSRHVIEFRSGDIASFWLLHTCNAAFAALSHLHQHPLLHPERLFERLLELAGALMTFSRTHHLGELPAYRHEAPQQPFEMLDGIVSKLLETVISTRCFAIALQELRSSYHQARLESQKIDANTRLFLGVRAALPATELVQLVPQLMKLGAADDVEKLVLSALQGVRLEHAPQVPPAIPVRPGALYFALEPRGPLYERMLQSRTLMLYAPAGLAQLELELFALNDGQ
ncbi:type VI secretion system baseplate subunit TssK [Azohydromonas lata]|uniref:type VI secretion system baseplate subunit TssK n=1 Tax=Azohydromonas lata TaxID=45677 RepID=UPI0008354933|nr:type VI secretion system baseplate subunit TssK [Azohydromonas lata]